MTNPLLQKYEELKKPQKPQKPQYDSEVQHSIQLLETLLKEIKEGRSVLIHMDTKRDINYLPPMSPMDYYPVSTNDPINFSTLPVQQGLQTTLTIFRRYV